MISRGGDDSGVNDVTAFVLAGGKSRRMGSDKAFLPWRGGTLLSHALKLAAAVADQVRIVGDACKFSSFGTVVEDTYRQCGPLGGIHAALTHSPSRWNLILAVDLPFLEPPFLEYLIARAKQAQSIVTVPRAGGGLQPLCAVYRGEFAAAAENSLKAGQNKIDPLFAPVDTQVIEQEELDRAGFNSRMFRNLNTPEDLEQATQGRF